MCILWCGATDLKILSRKAAKGNFWRCWVKLFITIFLVSKSDNDSFIIHITMSHCRQQLIKLVGRALEDASLAGNHLKRRLCCVMISAPRVTECQQTSWWNISVILIITSSQEKLFIQMLISPKGIFVLYHCYLKKMWRAVLQVGWIVSFHASLPLCRASDTHLFGLAYSLLKPDCQFHWWERRS